MAASLLKRRLANAPDDDGSAAALAELLPGKRYDIRIGPSSSPNVMTSTAGAVLTLQPDGSVFVTNPTRFRRHLYRLSRCRSVPDHRAAA